MCTCRKIPLIALGCLLILGPPARATQVPVSPGEELTLSLLLKNVGEVGLTGVKAQLEAKPAWVELADASPAVSVPPFAMGGATQKLPLRLAISEDVPPGAEDELRLLVRDHSEGSWPVVLVLRVVPQAYALHANFPNPFNPETSLRFELPLSGHVTLRVYNLAGQLVRSLVDGAKDAGVHQVTWTGLDNAGHPVAAGIYVCRLETEGFGQTRKMLLLK